LQVFCTARIASVTFFDRVPFCGAEDVRVPTVGALAVGVVVVGVLTVGATEGLPDLVHRLVLELYVYSLRHMLQEFSVGLYMPPLLQV